MRYSFIINRLHSGFSLKKTNSYCSLLWLAETRLLRAPVPRGDGSFKYDYARSCDAHPVWRTSQYEIANVNYPWIKICVRMLLQLWFKISGKPPPSVDHRFNLSGWGARNITEPQQLLCWGKMKAYDRVCVCVCVCVCVMCVCAHPGAGWMMVNLALSLMSIRQGPSLHDTGLENNAAWQMRAALRPKLHTRPGSGAGTSG